MSALSIRTRRLISVLALAGLVGLVLFAGVLPIVRDSATLDADRAAAYAEIARARSFARSAPSLAAAARELETAPLWSQLLVGESRTAVEAALFAQVRGFMDSGATLHAVEPLPPLSRDGLTRVGVRVQSTLTIDAVRNFVERVESAPQLLRFGALTITAPPVQSSLAPAQNEVLTLRAEIYGWTRIPGAST